MKPTYMARLDAPTTPASVRSAGRRTTKAHRPSTATNTGHSSTALARVTIISPASTPATATSAPPDRRTAKRVNNTKATNSAA